ncbi:OmpH family outer membrane protein [Larkinella rosea]|uniref:OmpH family outer membrane protein n=1 Tax=Larkinella rosea TaxID=2025312 RepID=A0A3P1BDK5_9BACT|nr:OmpH family outer membrane protein [Larkinella rosea]RRA99001.1 OmpH family outer membrane protein [Larkinella rosea]
MKNASLVLNAVLAAAVAVLYYLHFSENKTTEPVSATSTPSAPVRKTVYVNVDSLLTNYEYFKDTRKVLESKRFQLDNELNNKGRSLQNEVAFFQQRAQTMTMEQGRATEAALQKKQQDLVAYRDRIIQQLSLEEQKKNEELYNQIYDYLKKVNKQNQYDFVMGYSRGGGILYADNSLDATKTIIAGLNKEYQEKQTKK